MDVILKRCNGYRTFESEWREKWVPAILKYSGTLKTKEIKEVLGAVPQEDDGKQILCAYSLLWQILLHLLVNLQYRW